MRLLRLASAQGQMVKILEARLAQHEQSLAALSLVRSDLDRLACGSLSLAVLPMVLRRLAANETEVDETRRRIADLQKQLLAYKSRQKALESRARQLREASLRAAVEKDTAEAALLMTRKLPASKTW